MRNLEDSDAVANKPVNITVVHESQAGFANTVREHEIRMDRHVEAHDQI